MTIVKIDGLDTYYEIYGEGETLVLLHNGGFHSAAATTFRTG